MSLSNDRWSRLARLLFSGLMALAWSRGVEITAVKAQTAPAARASAHESPAEARERLDRYFRTLEAVRRDIPRETFDVSVVAARIGNDPAVAVAWVAEHTAWVPYRGMLRGPVGVLMDRRGNSLDRSALLAELLHQSGKTVRLAHGRLSQTQVRDLRGRARFTPQKPLAPPPGDDPQLVEKGVTTYAGPAALDAAAYRRGAQDLLFRSQHLNEELLGRSATQSSTLEQMVWKRPVSDPPTAASRSAQERAGEPPESEAIEDHWWVQLSDGGKWIDEDPDFAPADAERLPAPTESVDWRPLNGRWPVASKDCHEVELRVVIERLLDGRLSQTPVLRQVLRPSELIGQFIALGHMPMNWPGDLDLTREADPAARLKTLASEQHEWLPVLRIGPRTVYESSFTDSGEANPKPNVSQLRKTGATAGGVAGGAADVLDAPAAPAAPPPATGQLTAEWLEYETRAPGRAPQVIRRQLFDLIGPAARQTQGTVNAAPVDSAARLRRGLSLLGQVEILPLVCQLSPDFVNDLTGHNLLAMRDALTRLDTADDQNQVKEAAQQLQTLAPIPSRLYDLALARGFLNPHRDEVYLDSVNILSLHQSLLSNAAGALSFGVWVDIVDNRVAVRPDLGVENARRARLFQGVFDTNAESLISDTGMHAANIADQLAAHALSSDWLVLHNRDELAQPNLQIPGEIRSRVESELAHGFVVVVPRQADAPGNATGWWRIDPQSGQALGFDQDGWGSAMVEYGLFMSIMFTMCMAGAVAAGKAGDGNPHTGKAVGVCLLVSLGGACLAEIGAAGLTLKLIVGAMAAGGGAGYAL